MKLSVLIATTLLIIRPASACTAQPSPLSPNLPTKWESKPLAARVQPLEPVRPRWAHDDSWLVTGRIRVRVIETLKGLNEGQIFIIQIGWDEDRCGERFPNDKVKFEEFAKRSYYVGGDFRTIDDEKVFISTWSWRDYK